MRILRITTCLACAAGAALSFGATPRAETAVPTPNVELNTNVAGCADMRIGSTSATKSKITMSVELTQRERQPAPDDYPCICDGRMYYFGVFPRNASAAPEQVMSPGGDLRAYSHDFKIGDRRLKTVKRFSETVSFPYLKTAAGRAYPHYYIVFGCR